LPTSWAVFNDEPVHARPVSVRKSLALVSTKPALATLGALVLVLLLIAVVGALIAIVRIDRARVEVERNCIQLT
jgi:hypothetical protein